MILYKYVGHDAGLRMIETQTLGFRPPSFFNDPFEVSTAYAPPQSSGVEGFFDQVRLQAKKAMLAESHAILSLTRSPNNPLMWAHYGDQHKGWVIGFDLSDELFTAHERSTVPVQHGSVIYTATWPTYDFMNLPKDRPFHPGGQQNFDPLHIERLQRAFLYKSSVWAYEEEVRIVKCCTGLAPSGDFFEHPSGPLKLIHVGDPLYLLKLPAGSIKYVQAGLRTNPLSFAKIRSLDPSIKLYRSKIGHSTWTVESEAVGDP